MWKSHDGKSGKVCFVFALSSGDSFLAQKIEIGVAARTNINDSGEIPREIIRVAAIIQWKRKRKLQRGPGCPKEFAIIPQLAINGHLATGRGGLQERFTVTSKACAVGNDSRQHRDATALRGRDLIDSDLGEGHRAKQVPPARVGIGSPATICSQFFYSQAAYVPLSHVR